jgi:hypothetical protein
MTISITPATEALLHQEAAQTGQEPDALADALLADALARAAQEREETIEGIKRGLQAGEEGRERPVSEYIAEVQRKKEQRETADRA